MLLTERRPIFYFENKKSSKYFVENNFTHVWISNLGYA